jgi:threonine aldolase
VLYTHEEIRALCDTAHANGMRVFVDGARITHAMEALNTSLREMIEKTGVDVLTWGGTKAGLMFGEMTVFLHPEQAGNLAYSQKQSLQHMDKSKFLGVQFECLLSSGLWRETAGHANRMARRMKEAFEEKKIH